SFFIIERGSDSKPVVSLSVKGGKGPFFWNIPTEMKEDLDEVQLGVTFAPSVPADLTNETTHVDLNVYWQEESLSENRETIKITRDTAYRDIHTLLRWDNPRRELGEFTLPTFGEPIKVYEILKVKVVDKECKKTITRNIPIVVEIPTPSQEEIKNVRFAHRTTIKHTFNGSDVSKAQMMFYDTADNLLGKKSVNKDIAARCGETETVERWNWPPLDPITASTKYLTDINHLEVKRVQPHWAWGMMEHTIERFYIVGKNWVYFDDNGEKGYWAGIGGNDEDDIRCIPIGGKCPEKPASNNTKDGFTFDPIVNTPQGKWYLRCDPSSDTSIWCGGETIKFDADTDMNACHES
ncbi:MAG TPA: hypothetical protein PLT05_06240, partial [bacterium]|nr:hypothetical protein [bacterium]